MKKTKESKPAGPVFREITLNEIKPNPMNPRKRGFDGPAFDELEQRHWVEQDLCSRCAAGQDHQSETEAA